MKRRGFTITEMLVSLAIILFMMAIISGAFVAGLDSFRELKAVGDLDQRLRSATILIRNDLRAQHFDNNQPLSQIALPPAQGFFRILQGSPSIQEGVDADGIPSTRGTDANLQFTIKLLGGRQEDFHATLVGSGLLANHSPDAFKDGQHYLVQWSEVSYFLKPTGTTINGTPLYALHRRELLLYVPKPGLPDLNSTLNLLPLSLKPQMEGVSTRPHPLLPGVMLLNTPSTITAPPNRFGMQTPSNPLDLLNAGLPLPGGFPTLTESDVVLTDIISFEVKLANGGGGFVDLFDPVLAPLIQNPAFQGAGKPRAYDTWSGLTNSLLDFSSWDTPGTAKSMPMKLNIKALEITIRVWDVRTHRSRQITLIQDM